MQSTPSSWRRYTLWKKARWKDQRKEEDHEARRDGKDRVESFLACAACLGPVQRQSSRRGERDDGAGRPIAHIVGAPGGRAHKEYDARGGGIGEL